MAYSSAVLWGGSFGTQVVDGYSITPEWFGKLAPKTSYSGTASASYPPLSYNLKTETWGRTIPVSAGARRLSGHYIWAKVSQNLAQEQQYDADGTSTLDETSYLWNPFADIAVSFGYNGEPDATVSLTKLYFDGVEVVLSSLDYVFYPGTETQTADPTISADKGAANTPAFRGQVYIVIKQVDLSKFGNRFPAVSALVNAGADASFSERPLEPHGRSDLQAAYQGMAGANFATDQAWLVVGGFGVSATSRILEYDLSGTGAVTLTSTSAGIAQRGDIFLIPHYASWLDVFFSHDNLDDPLYTAESYVAWSRAGEVVAYLASGVATWNKDLKSAQFTPSVGSISTVLWHLRANGSVLTSPNILRVVTYDGSAFTIETETTEYINGLGSAHSGDAADLSALTSGLAIGRNGTDSAEAWMTVGVNGAASYKYMQLVRAVWNGSSLTTTAVGSPIDPGYSARVSGIAYVDDSAIVVVWLNEDTGTSGGAVRLTRDGAVTYQVDGLPANVGERGTKDLTSPWQSFHANTVIDGKMAFAWDYGVTPFTLTILNLSDGTHETTSFSEFTGDLVNEASNNSLVHIGFQSNGSVRGLVHIYNGDDLEFDPRAVLYEIGTAGSSTGTTLSGSIIGRGTVLAELDADQITTVNLDDEITGWLVWENAEFKSHLTNDGALFGFDYFESGTGIKCIRHVDGSTFTVNRVLTDADLLLMENDTAQISRVDEQDIPAIGKVNYIDPSVEYRVSSQRARRARYPIPAVNSNRTAEYTTSVIMDATTALSQCAKALFREDTGRVAITFMLKRTQLAVEVGDIVQLPAIDGKVFTVRIVEWILQPDFSMQCTGLVLLENEAISLNSSGGESFTYTNGAPRLMRSPFIRSTARVFPATIADA